LLFLFRFVIIVINVVVVCGAAQSVSLCHSFLLYLLLILLSSVPLLLGCSNNNSQNSNVLGPVLVFSPCLSHSYLSVSLYPSAGWRAWGQRF